MTDIPMKVRAVALHWRKPSDHPQDSFGEADIVCIAFGLGGRYTIRRDDFGCHVWWPEDEFTFDTYPDIVAAKTAAENHWQTEFAKRVDDMPHGMPRAMYERGFIPPHITDAINTRPPTANPLPDEAGTSGELSYADFDQEAKPADLKHPAVGVTDFVSFRAGDEPVFHDGEPRQQAHGASPSAASLAHPGDSGSSVIVARLREMGDILNAASLHRTGAPSPEAALMNQAADFIDRLSTDRDSVIEECAKVADAAKLPDGYRWGAEAMEQFDFGKECAAAAIRARRTV